MTQEDLDNVERDLVSLVGDKRVSNTETLILRRIERASASTASQEDLNELSKSSISHVRCAVALNPKTNAGLLLELSRDSNPHVRRAVLNDAKKPKSLLVFLRSGGYGELTYEEFLEKVWPTCS